MNNTELTLDQLSEVAGGAPHYTTWYRNKRTNRKPIWTTGGTASVWTSGGVTSYKKRFDRVNKMGGQEGEA